MTKDEQFLRDLFSMVVDNDYDWELQYTPPCSQTWGIQQLFAKIQSPKARPNKFQSYSSLHNNNFKFYIQDKWVKIEWQEALAIYRYDHLLADPDFTNIRLLIFGGKNAAKEFNG